MPMPWTLQGLDFRFVVVNDAFCQLSGYSRAELIGMDPVAIHPAEVHADMWDVRRRWGPDLLEVGDWITLVRELIHKSGRRLPYRLVLGTMADHRGDPHIYGLYMDLRLLKWLHGRVRSQMDWIREAFEHAPVGMILTDANGTALANAAAHDLTGEPDDAAIARRMGVDGSSVADDLRIGDESPVGPGQSLAGSNGTLASQVEFTTPNGRRHFQRRVLRLGDRHADQRVLTVFTDVTREVELHHEVQSALLQQSAILRCVSTGLAHVVGEIIVQVNREMLRLTGREERGLIGQPIDLLFGGSIEWESLRRQLDQPADAVAGVRRTVELASQDGHCWQGMLSVQWVQPGRRDLGILITFTEVSELIQRSAALQASVEHMRRLIDAQPMGVVQLRDGRIVRANPALARMLGVPGESLIGRSMVDLVQEAEAMAQRLEAARDFRGEAQPVADSVLHVTLRIGNGRACDALVMLTATADTDDLTAIIVDISGQRALADRAVRDGARFDGFANLTADAMLIIEDGKIKFANTRLAELSGVPVSQWLGEAIDAARADCTLDLEDRRQVARAYERLMQDGGGTTGIVIGIAHPLLGHRSLRVRLFANPSVSRECFVLGEDITESLRLERERLEEAIVQRDRLVGEVHHRIKNNLQGVAGLLQQIGSQRPEVAEYLNDASHQIQAIARVHGLEVRTGEIVDLRRFIEVVVNGAYLHGLDDRVLVHFGQGMDQHAWGLPQSEAVPIALILNELLTNALRHGAGAGVSVEVDAESSGTSIHILGGGRLPEAFDFARIRAGATGLGLVKSLLPRRGAALGFSTTASGIVRASLALTAPTVRSRHTDAVSGEAMR
ncbi:MAG: PAS domain S-box protein [Burkholderiaceae bacterium]